MNWAELIRIAEEHGYEFKKHGSNHDIYYNKEKRDILVVERHKSQEVKKGLMSKLKKQIGF